MIKGFYGDPDEFQASSFHDEADATMVSQRSPRLEPRQIRKKRGPDMDHEVRPKRRVSIEFSGTRFFLEK
jgi:hypothetical protein